MNALAEKYGDKLGLIGFPCNQFGHQTNEGNDEFLNTLQYVRPGDGFKPAPTITITEKGFVNGDTADPLWKWMKSEALIPCDDYVDTKENGVANPDALVLPRGMFGGSTVVLWTPVARSDIAWNFEKFLLDGEGKVVKRYSRYYDTNEISKDIDELLK
jgi:glutathione peroxidase